MTTQQIRKHRIVFTACLLSLTIIFSTSCKKPDFTKSTAATPEDSLPIKALADPPSLPAVNFPANLLTKFPANKWMEKVPGKVKISHLSIPGTKWSARYGTSSTSQYQNKSISQQLNMGVRYLHISVSQGAFQSVYVEMNGTSVSFGSFVDTVKAFLVQNPNETVIVRLEQGSFITDPEAWAQIGIKSVVDQNLNYFYKWPNFFTTASQSQADWPSLNELRGKIMLVSWSIYLKANNFVRVVESNQIKLGWNSNGTSTVTAPLSTQFSNYTGNSKFSHVWATMDYATTINAAATKLYFNETGKDQSSSSSILSDANYVNPRVEDVLEGYYNSLPNSARFGILAMNYLSDYDTKLIYLSNFNRDALNFKSTVIRTADYPYNADGSIGGSYPLAQLTSSYSEQPSGSVGSYSMPVSVWDYYHPTSWMSKIPNYTPINMVTMPGTHDAGTSTGSLLGKCQDWSIPIQLTNGVRFFDFRLIPYTPSCNVPSAAELIFRHGMEYYYSLKWKNVLTDLTNFLAQHPSETIIIWTSIGDQTCGDVNGQELFIEETTESGKLDYFWQGATPTTSELTWPTMGELRGKILLMYGNLGIPRKSVEWEYSENTIGMQITPDLYGTSSYYTAWVQGNYEINFNPVSWNDVLAAKWTYINDCWDRAVRDPAELERYDRMFFNGTSYAQPDPRTAANYINPLLRGKMEGRWHPTGGWPDIPGRIGVLSMDFVDWALTGQCYLMNFSRTRIMNSF